jgi:hypothetical protein
MFAVLKLTLPRIRMEYIAYIYIYKYIYIYTHTHMYHVSSIASMN